MAFMESRIDTVFDHDLALGIGPLFILRGNPSFFFVWAQPARPF